MRTINSLMLGGAAAALLATEAATAAAAPETTAAPAEDAKPTYEVGSPVEFVGYAQLEDGQEELLKVGDQGEITVVNADGSFIFKSSTGIQETLFDDEFKPSTAPAKSRARGKAGEAGLKAPKKAQLTDAEKAKAKADKEAEKARIKAEKEEANKPPPLVLTEAVAELLGEEGAEGSDKVALDAVEDIIVRVETGFFNLGGLLAHIQETGAFKAANYDAFDTYVEKEITEKHPDISLGRRKAYDLISIYRKFSALGIPNVETRLAEIGYTFARAAAKVVDNENFDALVEKATEMSRDDFEAHIKTTYAKEGTGTADNSGKETTPKVEKTKFGFVLFADKGAVAKKALEEATSQLADNEKNDNNAFGLIAAEWLTLQSGESISLEDKVAALEAQYGVELSIFDPAAPVETDEAPTA